MTLTEWLLLIIAIPCAALTLVGLFVAWIYLVTWWDGFKYRNIPGYAAYRDRKSTEQVKKWIKDAEKQLAKGDK